MTPDAITIRRGTADDVPTILHQRRAMFEAMGGTTPQQLDRMQTKFEPWLRAHIANERYLAWFATAQADGREVVAAGLGVWLFEWVPGPLTADDAFGGTLRPYILNVYTEPAYRRHGLARTLVETAVAWCQAQGFRLVSLHASDEGRPLYELLGFQATNEYRLML